MVWPIALVTAAVATLASLAQWHARTGLLDAQALADQAAAEDAVIQIPGEQVKVAASDFSQSLPVSANADAATLVLQNSARSQGAVLMSLAANPRHGTERVLGRIELAVTVGGTYAQIKAVLAAVTQQVPGVLIQRLSLRRTGLPTELEAQLEIWLLSRPWAGESRVEH